MPKNKSNVFFMFWQSSNLNLTIFFDWYQNKFTELPVLFCLVSLFSFLYVIQLLFYHWSGYSWKEFSLHKQRQLISSFQVNKFDKKHIMLLTCARTADANCKLGSNVSGTTCIIFFLLKLNTCEIFIQSKKWGFIRDRKSMSL